ncbi:unnamed protein product [marine sediment metagenome]|uniref:Uncharacterized protein n=1 Tax=marine sediment metagenome TaxID=412755 RepID=X1LVV7_9ZZZZ
MSKLTKSIQKVKSKSKNKEGKHSIFNPIEVGSPLGWARLYSHWGFLSICFPSISFNPGDSKDLEREGIIVLNRGKGKRFLYSILAKAKMEKIEGIKIWLYH